jgi:hypothetical protein
MASLTIEPIATVAPGNRGVVRFSIDAAVPGVATVIIHLPLKPDNTAYAVDPVVFVPNNPFRTQKMEAYFDMPALDLTGQIVATAQVNYIGFDNGQLYAPAATAEFVVAADGGAPGAGGPPPLVPGLPAQYDLVWQWAGDIYNAAEQVGDTLLKQTALNIQGHIQFLKGEVSSDPLKPGR